MKKLIMIMLILTGLLCAEDYTAPQIISVKWEIYHSSIEFVDFYYSVEIQGTNRSYTMLLEITLYDEDETILKVFKEVVKIKPNMEYLQEMTNIKILPIDIAKDVIDIGVELKELKGKH